MTRLEEGLKPMRTIVLLVLAALFWAGPHAGYAEPRMVPDNRCETKVGITLTLGDNWTRFVNEDGNPAQLCSFADMEKSATIFLFGSRDGKPIPVPELRQVFFEASYSSWVSTLDRRPAKVAAQKVITATPWSVTFNAVTTNQKHVRWGGEEVAMAYRFLWPGHCENVCIKKWYAAYIPIPSEKPGTLLLMITLPASVYDGEVSIRDSGLDEFNKIVETEILPFLEVSEGIKLADLQ